MNPSQNEENKRISDQTPQLSRPNETVDQTVARAKAMTSSISADKLVQPVRRAPVTPVPEQQLPDQKMVDNVMGSVRSQSENAQRLAEEQGAFQAFAEDASGFDLQQEQLERFGVTPEKLSRLEDIQTQLARSNTDSSITQSRIAGAAGQTLSQGQREITQEQREQSIRSSGLAAEAAILQGNIQTGRALAKDAVTVALADRSFKANAQLTAIKDLKEVVNEETRQLLEVEERKYIEEKENIARMENAVDTAVSTGAATAEQMALMTDPNATDQQRLNTALEVVSASSSETRNLELQKLRQSIASSAVSAKKSRLGLCQAGDKSACSEFNIDTSALTEEQIQARIENQNQSLSLQNDLVRLEGVLNNETGLQLSSGLFQSPALAAAGSAATFAVSPTQAVANVAGFPASKETKEQFLGDIQYLLGNRVFEKVAEIKASGYAGAVSDTELNLLANASSALNPLAVRDEANNIIGFRGGEENLRTELNTYIDIYKRANDALNIDALTTPEKGGIIKAYNE